MKAIVERKGVLQWLEVADPSPGEGEVLIRVRATAVNRADLAQRAGRYPPPPGASEILGLECAGVIEKVGPGVSPERVGEQVCALLAGGGYAQRVTCPSTHALPLPDGFDFTTAAAVPEVFATAWLNLKLEAGLAKGEQVLIHAGASGVGTAAIQLCRLWGNPVFATVGSEAKCARCLELGAEQAWNRHRGAWEPAVKEWGGADVILDPVGGDYLEPNLRSLRSRGRLINIGLLGGAEGTLSMGRLLVKRLTVRGSVLRSRSVAEKDVVMEGLNREVWPALADGRLAAVIDRRMPITQVEQAHGLLKSNETVGKVVLEVE